MHITRWGEFGILCALHLARRFETGSVSAAEIADSQGIPIQYTQQILQRLRKGKVIKSLRGPRGGYTLSCDPAQINLRQVLQAAEGETFNLHCESNPVYPGACPSDLTCTLGNVWRELKIAIDSALEKHTLQKLISTQKTVAPSEQLVSLKGRH